jgi:hypothetical protein
MLPDIYEPLLLSFHDPSIVDGATVIGNDYGTQFRLVDSAIISVDPAAEVPARFVNSSVDQLSACIAAHIDYGRAIDAANDDEAEFSAVESFATTIQRIDPECLSNPENWWAVIVEQMRNGQL